MGIEPIPAYSPQARGRSERSFGTWQGRLPQELRIRQIQTVDDANHFLRSQYIAEFNRKFTVPASQPGTAFVPVEHLNLDRIFSVQHERVVAKDNTIQFANHVLQVPSTRFRATLAGCRVTVYEHLNATLSIGYGPHTVARFNSECESKRAKKTVESAAAVEIRNKRGFPPAAWKAQNAFHTSHSLGAGSTHKRAKSKQ